MQRIVECVPNFSEGRDPAVLDAIAAAIRSVEGVKLLDVDPGKATNRTVFTFVGEPEPVVEAAVRAARVGGERIDMRRHTGEHPRFGAMDVCPIVPVSGVTLAEAAEIARGLGKRLADELGMTIYLYEAAATRPERKNLSVVRAGEYEGLADKLSRPEWKPDFGPAKLDEKRGATAVGARDFLIAYNVNLNTTSTRRANAIAYDVREKGRIKRTGDPVTGEIVRDAKGEPVWEPGSLKAVKAIGWFIEEYGVAQISMNLTDISVTPIHVAFDEVVKKADARGVRVTGSEIVGLVPLRALLDAGRHYLRKQRRSVGVPERELIHIAVKSMGLDELKPFVAEERVIEYLLEDRSRRKLVDLTVRGFAEKTAGDSPAPGGGSVSAAMAAFGAALGAMVANLSSHKAGWDARWEEFSEWAERATRCYDEALALVDRDTDAFNALMAAFGLPKSSDAEKKARTEAIQAATRGAIEVPLRCMEVAVEALEVAAKMAEIGMPSSVSDAGVGCLAARSAALGAWLNVRINAKDLADRALADRYLSRGRELADRAETLEKAAIARVTRDL